MTSEFIASDSTVFTHAGDFQCVSSLLDGEKPHLNLSATCEKVTNKKANV